MKGAVIKLSLILFHFLFTDFLHIFINSLWTVPFFWCYQFPFLPSINSSILAYNFSVPSQRKPDYAINVFLLVSCWKSDTRIQWSTTNKTYGALRCYKVSKLSVIFKGKYFIQNNLNRQCTLVLEKYKLIKIAYSKSCNVKHQIT